MIPLTKRREVDFMRVFRSACRPTIGPETSPPDSPE